MQRIIFLGILIIMFLAACTAAEETPAPTPAPEAAATAIPLDPAATPEPQELTLWLPDWMVLKNPEAADLLQGIVDEFGTEKGVEIEIIPKLQRGPSGLLDSLEKTYPVAPAVLPDLIALSLTDAEIAIQKELLQPFGELISAEIQADIYPFAQNIARTEEAWYALPFVAEFEHLAFQPSALSDPPLNWQVVLDGAATYAFPAAGSEATLTDAVLVHYLSAVGADDDANRNGEALRKTLIFYEFLQQTGLVDESTLQAKGPEDTWSVALQGDVALAHTSSTFWLRDQEQATALRFGPIPTADSTPRYMAHGWAYAIVTADPAKQALVAELIGRLMAPESLAVWSRAAHHLPARRTALAQWPADDYQAFANEALEIAFRPPGIAFDAEFTRSVHRAALDVLSGTTDVETAAQEAIESW